MDFPGLEQALQQLKEKLPIERARMRLKLQIPVTCRNDLMQLLTSQQATTESEDLGLHNSQVRHILPLMQLRWCQGSMAWMLALDTNNFSKKDGFWLCS